MFLCRSKGKVTCKSMYNVFLGVTGSTHRNVLQNVIFEFSWLGSCRKPPCSAYEANVTGNPWLDSCADYRFENKFAGRKQTRIGISRTWDCTTLFKIHCLKKRISTHSLVGLRNRTVSCFMNGSNVKPGILKTIEMQASLFSLQLCKLCIQTCH